MERISAYGAEDMGSSPIGGTTNNIWGDIP